MSRRARWVGNHSSASAAASPPGETLVCPSGLRGSQSWTPRCTLGSYRWGLVAERCPEAADEPGSLPSEAPRSPSRVRGVRPAAGRRARGPEPGRRPAGRGRRGQERAPRLSVRPGRGLVRRAGGGRGVGDGAGLCRPASAVRAPARPPRPAPSPAAQRAHHGLRPQLGRLEICRSARVLPLRPGGPLALDLLLDGLALLTTDGHAAATPTLQRAAKALAGLPVEDVLRWGWMATAASNAVWDNDGASVISARQVRLVRDAGALAELPLYLSALGLARAWTGDFVAAEALAAEADSVGAATGSRSAPFTLLRLRALQGRLAEASAAIEQAAAAGTGVAVYAHWAAAVQYNGLARYEEAVAAARQATSDTFEYWVSAWALPELVEAAVRAGDAELARDALGRLAETMQPAAPTSRSASRPAHGRC